LPETFKLLQTEEEYEEKYGQKETSWSQTTYCAISLSSFLQTQKVYTGVCMHRTMIHLQEASTFSIRVSPLVLGTYLIIKNLSKLLVQLQNPKLQSSEPIRMMFQ
jgi:hypothetical protein